MAKASSVAFLKLQHSSQMLKHVPERMAVNLLALLVLCPSSEDSNRLKAVASAAS